MQTSCSERMAEGIGLTKRSTEAGKVPCSITGVQCCGGGREVL